MPAVIVTARHGERLDYITRDSGGNWVADAERPWDPPLSDHGIEQGAKLGKHLADELERLGLPPLSAVYTSPFLRCRQTAVASFQGYNAATSNMDSSKTNVLPPVRIELGLAESINESWYRSWALPGTNGTWGFRTPGQDTIDPVTLHPASKQPVQSIIDWQATLSAGEDTSLDLDYVSVTTLTQPYCFHPPLLESRKDQRRRMMDTVSNLAQPGTTVLLVSHGGPVTHLFEEMTGKNWTVHGESSYCCYSIYKRNDTTDTATTNKEQWEALSVNQSSFLHEKITTERHVSEGA
jgi:broad specificity phosphatase PhoE